MVSWSLFRGSCQLLLSMPVVFLGVLSEVRLSGSFS